MNFVLAAFLQINDKWTRVLQGGELFIFSSTLAATAIGQRLLAAPGTRHAAAASAAAQEPLLPVFAVGALILTLVIATSLSAVASYHALSGKTLPNPKLIARGSLASAIAASVLSFYMSVA